MVLAAAAVPAAVQAAVPAAVMAATPHVLHWGWFSIELANLLIILSMVAVFVLALVVPFGRPSRVHDDTGDRA